MNAWFSRDSLGTDVKNQSKVENRNDFDDFEGCGLQRCPETWLTPRAVPQIKANQRGRAWWRLAVMQADVSSDKSWFCLTAMLSVRNGGLAKLLLVNPTCSVEYMRVFASINSFVTQAPCAIYFILRFFLPHNYLNHLNCCRLNCRVSLGRITRVYKLAWVHVFLQIHLKHLKSNSFFPLFQLSIILKYVLKVAKKVNYFMQKMFTTIQSTSSFNKAMLLLQIKKSIFEFIVSEFSSFFTRLIMLKKRNAEEKISRVWNTEEQHWHWYGLFLLPFPRNMNVKLQVCYCCFLLF